MQKSQIITMRKAVEVLFSFSFGLYVSTHFFNTWLTESQRLENTTLTVYIH